MFHEYAHGYQMILSIQEWTQENLWKTAFKKLEGIWLLKADHTINSTWSILEYFVPNSSDLYPCIFAWHNLT